MSTHDEPSVDRLLPQQQSWSGYAPLRRQASAQHGQKSEETQPLLRPTRSFNPRPGH